MRGAARSGRPQGNTRKKNLKKNDLRSTGLSGKKSRTQGELPCRVLNAGSIVLFHGPGSRVRTLDAILMEGGIVTKKPTTQQHKGTPTRERGSHSHTVVITRPRLSLAL